MSLRARLVLPLIVIMALALGSCTNFPSAVQGPQLSNDDIANTAVAKVFAAQTAAAPLVVEAPAVDVPVVEELAAPAATAGPTQCIPIVTALTNANVRGGDDVAYAVVGNLPPGATAPVAGRNDDTTWWYIQFAGGYGGYAWIAASVVTPSCIPPTLQIVAAPPLPTEEVVVVQATKTPKKLLPLLIVTLDPHPHLEVQPQLMVTVHINP